MLTLTTLEQQQVRVHIDEQGQTWWVALDVGDILGIAEVRSTLRSWLDDEKGVHTMPTAGGSQAMLTLNEPGLYRLIFQSRKPEAEAFKRWIFRDVLPSLRKTGAYTVPGREMPARVTASKTEVSIHLARVWRLLGTSEEWLSNREIASRTGIAQRTARAHTRYLLDIGLIERQEVFPRHLYKRCTEAERQHVRAWKHLESCTEVLLMRAEF